MLPNDNSKVMNMKSEKHMHTNIAQKKKKADKEC